MNINVRVLGYKELLLNLIQARDSFITLAFVRLYFCKGVYVLLLFLLKAIPEVKWMSKLNINGNFFGEILFQ